MAEAPLWDAEGSFTLCTGGRCVTHPIRYVVYQDRYLIQYPDGEPMIRGSQVTALEATHTMMRRFFGDQTKEHQESG